MRKLPSGRWQARYSGPDGKDRPAPDTFETKADAERWLSAVETDLARGQWIDPSANETTLRQWSVLWRANRPDLKVRTRELYDWLLEKSPTPARQSYLLLRAMLSTAVADEVILRNPCAIKGAGVSGWVQMTARRLPIIMAVLLPAVLRDWRGFFVRSDGDGKRLGRAWRADGSTSASVNRSSRICGAAGTGSPWLSTDGAS